MSYQGNELDTPHSILGSPIHQPDFKDVIMGRSAIRMNLETWTNTNLKLFWRRGTPWYPYIIQMFVGFFRYEPSKEGDSLLRETPKKEDSPFRETPLCGIQLLPLGKHTKKNTENHGKSWKITMIDGWWENSRPSQSLSHNQRVYPSIIQVLSHDHLYKTIWKTMVNS